MRVCGVSALLFGAGCAQDFDKLHVARSPRGSLGEEVYKALCRRIAGTELPRDLDGRETTDLCLGEAGAVASDLAARRDALPTRLVALAERRARLVDAVDAMMPGRLSTDLETLLRGLLPYYDPPDDLLPQNSRALAAIMRRVAADPAARAELARIGRVGMLPVDAQAGALAALASHGRVAELFAALVPSLFGGAADAEFRKLRELLAFELATAQPESDDDRVRRERFTRTAWLADASGAGAFGTGEPAFTALRGPDGLPVPSAASYPFVDTDGDGAADVAGDALVLDDAFTGAPPEPFPVVGEGDVPRDAAGRACAYVSDGSADCEHTLYAYTEDRDATWLAAAAREAHRVAGTGSTSLVGSALAALPGLVEPRVVRRERYGNASVEVPAIDRDDSALLELAHAASALTPTRSYDESLGFSARLLGELESPLVRVLASLADVERATRPASDAYPGARLAEDHTFWDDLTREGEKLARRRLTANGEGAIAAMSRAALGVGRDVNAPGQPLVQLVDRDQLRHEGALLATFMRFKDEWRINPRGDSERAPGEPVLIGAFRTPVDRSQPDAPVTCGVDGCGGLLEGTPFAPYGRANQNCVVQRAGRPASGRDCGAPANQSILQRSMSLLWEMAGRSQCNKPISLHDLLDFVNDDPCQVLDPPLACAADAECAAGLGTGFVCDTARSTCVAPPNSQICGILRRDRQRQVDDTADQAAQALAKDYVCSGALPDAPCHDYEAQFPSAFAEAADGAPGDAAVAACHLLDLRDVGRTFGRVLTKEFTLEIPNPWVRRYLEDVARASPGLGLPRCEADFHIADPTQVPSCTTEAAGLTRDFYKTLPDEVDTLGELVEFLLDDASLFATDADTTDLRPDSKALSHVLFAGKGESSLEIFDTLLIRGAPATCADAPGLPACAADDTAATPAGGCCIADLHNAPLRYRLDTFYGSTSFAWEQPIAFEDGTTLSFLDTMAPLADAFNRLDYIAGSDDPANFEDLAYGLTSIGKLVAEHYDTAANPLAQSRAPDGMWYRRGTGLSSYEPVFADVLDDGTVDYTQTGPLGDTLFGEDAAAAPAYDVFRAGFDFLAALDALEVDGGEDGIDVSARVTEALLNPHAYCAGDGGDGRVIGGVGACDREDAARRPLGRRGGRDFPCASDGTCYDGERAERRYLSALGLTAEALHDFDLNSRGDQRARDGLRGLLSGLVDGFAEFRGGRLASRRLWAWLLTDLAHARTRWAEARAKGTLGQLAAESEDDLDHVLAQPLTGTLVELASALGRDDTLVTELDALASSLLAPDNARLWTLIVSDMLAGAEVGATYVAMQRALASALAPNVDAVIGGDAAALMLDGSYVATDLRLLAEVAKDDTNGTLASVLRNAFHAPSADRHAPYSVLSEAVLALQREDPRALAQPDGADLRHALDTMADALLDDRRGFERLYAIVRCATSPGSALCD